jgi:hypothetical protein
MYQKLDVFLSKGEKDPVQLDLTEKAYLSHCTSSHNGLSSLMHDEVDDINLIYRAILRMFIIINFPA